MVSQTSQTTLFSLDVDDILEAALEPLGGEHQSGIQAEKARRTLNLLLIKLQNKNIPLFKIDFVDVPLMLDGNGVGITQYDLESDIVDILELNLLDLTTGISTNPTSGTQIPMERYGLEEYHHIPNKFQPGRPTVWATERLRGNERVHVWPVPPANANYAAPATQWVLKLLCTKRVEDVNAAYQRLDIGYRYLPLITAWLSYDLGVAKPSMDMNKLATLKDSLTDIMKDTFEEDRERADMKLIPGGISGR